MSKSQPNSANLVVSRYLAIAFILIMLGVGVMVFSKSSPTFGSIFSFGDNRTAEAEKSLREKITADSDGNINLESFTKTDGQESEAFGVKLYSLDFNGEVTFRSNGFWHSRDTMGGGKTTFLFSSSAGIFPGLNGTLQVSAGNHVKISGTMSGQKSENGWHFSLSDCRYTQE